jgi:putative hydrolase of HD superfamily
MKKIVNYFFEINNLKRIKRSGSWIAGINNPDTIAEHAFRTAQIGYVLAELEKADSNRTLLMCLFHDNAEVRIGDHHKIMARYMDTKKAEKLAIKDQLKNLPTKIADKLAKIANEFNKKETKEAIIAKDADLLELAMQAKEYLEIGYQGKQNWLDNIKVAIQTKSGKKMFEAV